MLKPDGVFAASVPLFGRGTTLARPYVAYECMGGGYDYWQWPGCEE